MRALFEPNDRGVRRAVGQSVEQNHRANLVGVHVEHDDALRLSGYLRGVDGCRHGRERAEFTRAAVVRIGDRLLRGCATRSPSGRSVVGEEGLEPSKS
jgi:hypothetical protein